MVGLLAGANPLSSSHKIGELCSSRESCPKFWGVLPSLLVEGSVVVLVWLNVELSRIDLFDPVPIMLQHLPVSLPLPILSRQGDILLWKIYLASQITPRCPFRGEQSVIEPV